MALDHSYVGRKYPPTAPYQVGREKIREFAAAIGATDPAYHDPAAARALGHPDPRVRDLPVVMARRGTGQRLRGRRDRTAGSRWRSGDKRWRSR